MLSKPGGHSKAQVSPCRLSEQVERWGPQDKLRGGHTGCWHVRAEPLHSPYRHVRTELLVGPCAYPALHVNWHDSPGCFPTHSLPCAWAGTSRGGHIRSEHCSGWVKDRTSALYKGEITASTNPNFYSSEPLDPPLPVEEELNPELIIYLSVGVTGFAVLMVFLFGVVVDSHLRALGKGAGWRIVGFASILCSVVSVLCGALGLYRKAYGRVLVLPVTLRVFGIVAAVFALLLAVTAGYTASRRRQTLELYSSRQGSRHSLRHKIKGISAHVSRDPTPRVRTPGATSRKCKKVQQKYSSQGRDLPNYLKTPSPKRSMKTPRVCSLRFLCL